MKPKKSLGQNFLVNPKVAERIAFEADISKKDIVLEIGPGTGKLTKCLLARAKKVIAVEKDESLANELAEKFKKEIKDKKLILINEDILKFKFTDKIFSDSPRKFSAENFPRPPSLRSGESGQVCPSPSLLPRVRSRTFCPPLSYKIIANIPYNITGAILKKFLSEKNQPKSMTLMVQKEVAERIVGSPRHGGARRKESLLSISVKAYGEPKILFKVSRGNFYPIPNVDSAVIAIKNISRKIFTENKISEEKFWEIIRAGFAHKRKKLSSNLKKLDPLLISPLAGGEKTPMTRGVGEFIDLGNKRAEELTLADWINLAKVIDINKKG